MTHATFHTSEGTIELELTPADAPKTVENFTSSRARASTTGSRSTG